MTETGFDQNRRDFLKTSAVAFGCLLLGDKIKLLDLAAGSASFQVDSFYDKVNDRLQKPEVDANNKELLLEHIESIRPDEAKFAEIIDKNNKDFFNENGLDDFIRYYPIYKAAEIKYKIPWFLLWIIHEKETGASRHPRPEQNGYIGAMQRGPKNYDEEYVDRAVEGFEYLSLLAGQRYRRPPEGNSRSDDYREIFFAAKKLSEDAESLREKYDYTFEESILRANYSYCNARFVPGRIALYRKFKNAFQL